MEDNTKRRNSTSGPARATEKSPSFAVDPLMKQEEAQPIVVVDDTTLAPFYVSAINLLKTIIGAGILALPWALSCFGFIPGMCVMLLAAGLAALGLHLLTVAACSVGRNASTAALCKITYPKAVIAFEIAIAVKCIGAAAAYLGIIGNTCVNLAQAFISADTLGPFFASILHAKPFWVLTATLCISPVCLMRKMDSLKYTSFAGMAAVLYLVILTVWNYFQTSTATFTNMVIFAKPSLNCFKAFGVFVFAFTCHQNILPIQNEARKNSPTAMAQIISFSVGFSTFLYIIEAVFGYATYGSSIKDVILDNFPNKQWPFVAARIFYVFLLIFSYPLQVLPSRNCIQKIFTIYNDEFAQKAAQPLYFGSTAAIMGISAAIAAFTSSIELILRLVGSTSGTFLCYFLPAIICLKLEQDRPMNLRKIGSFVLIFAGIATFVSSMISIFWK